MYQYKFGEESAKQTGLNQTKSLRSILEEIDKKYNVTMPSKPSTSAKAPELEKVTFTPKSEQELKTEAENSLSAYKQNSLNDINQSYISAMQDAENKQKDIEETKSQTEAKLAEKLSNSLENAASKANRQGISRSSILQGMKDAATDDFQNNLSLANKEAENGLGAIKARREALEDARRSALESFDLTYAVKLQDKLTSLKDKENSAYLKAITTNNSVEKSLADFDYKLSEQERKNQNSYYKDAEAYMRLVDTYGKNGIAFVAENEKFDAAKAHFENLSKQEAIDEVLANFQDYKKLLGSKYDALLSYIVSK